MNTITIFFARIVKRSGSLALAAALLLTAANAFVLTQTPDPVTELVKGESSREHNHSGMHGAGPIEMLAREMTADLHNLRDTAITNAELSQGPVTMSLNTKGVHFGTITAFSDGTLDTSGVQGVDLDLIVKPFDWAGQGVFLREFTGNTMNQPSSMPTGERFDFNLEKGEGDVIRELTAEDITAVTLWQASLATPGQLLPDTIAEQGRVNLGETLSAGIGCTSCHIPELYLDDRHYSEPSPYNPPHNGNDFVQTISFDMTAEGQDQRLERRGDGAIVRAYTDLKRHSLCDSPDHPDPIRFLCTEERAQNQPDENGRPDNEFFLTRKLWDIGNSGPYGYRGDLTTLTQAILVHGGEARASRDAFAALADDDQTAIITFFKTLQVLPPGTERIMTVSAAATPQPTSRTDTIALILVVLTAVALIPITLKTNNR